MFINLHLGLSASRVPQIERCVIIFPKLKCHLGGTSLFLDTPTSTFTSAIPPALSFHRLLETCTPPLLWMLMICGKSPVNEGSNEDYPLV